MYSSVTGCWLREMLKQGVFRGRISLVWGQQTSNSLGDDGRDLFHFLKKISLWNKLRTSNSLTVFLIKSFLSY